MKIACESGDLNAIEDEIGDCFFSLINLSRHLKISAENSIRKSNEKFLKRFKKMEVEISKMGKKIDNISILEFSKLWEDVK